MRTEHVYVTYGVQAPAGPVWYLDVMEALRNMASVDIKVRRSRIRCGLERERVFCPHCKDCTYTEISEV